MVRTSQAVIAIDGGYGTLTEIGFALQAQIPVIGLNTWELSIDGRADRHIIPARNAGDAVAKAFALINKNEYPVRE